MNITQEKLNELVKNHDKWLRVEEGGQRLDLRGADLSYADLGGADLDKKYVQVSCIGSRRGITTYNATDDIVLCGCWNNYKGGTLDEFTARVESVYGESGNNPNEQYYGEYMAAIEFFKTIGKMEEMK